MLSPGKNKLLVVSDDQFKQVRKAYGVTSTSLKKYVDILVSWYMTQSHLPQVPLDREWLERLLIINKCSVERTKDKLEYIFTTRTTMPEYFANRNPVECFRIGKLGAILCPLPRLSSDNSRVFMVKYYTSSFEYYNLNTILNATFMINDYRRNNDYCLGDRYVTDTTNLTLRHMFSNPNTIRKGEYINRKVFGHRVAGIHLLFPKNFLKYGVSVLKWVLSTKLGSRIHIHEDLESLHKTISREILPREYGGDEKPFDEILDDWEAELCSEKQLKWFKDQQELKSDESLRK